MKQKSNLSLTSVRPLVAVIAAHLIAAPFAAPLLVAEEPSAPVKAAAAAPAAKPSQPAEVSLKPDEALQRLMEGNQRYVHNTLTHPDQSPARRAELVQGQHPFAVVLGCSDSRVAPEILFDQGLGDLFVVRVAGNVLSEEGIASLEYAVEHLHTPLIVVLGHAKCGAVTAAVAGGHAPGHIHRLVEDLEPAVKAVRGKPGDVVELAAKANVERVTHILDHMQPILEEQVKAGKLKIVGARYDVSSGAVELLH